MIKQQTIEIIVQSFDSVDELPAQHAQLVFAAQEACNNAYAPYSDFRVGAALLLNNGEMVCGGNQENIAYPSGMCAERVALYYANARYPSASVLAMAICSAAHGVLNLKPVYPCGACRQVMVQTELRQASSTKVIMAGTQCIQAVESARDLLPLCFEL